jgi:segregation and condensation protein B
MSLKAKLEAVIYAAEEPVTLAQLATLFASDTLAWKAEREAASAVDGLEGMDQGTPINQNLPLLTDALEEMEQGQSATDPAAADAPSKPTPAEPAEAAAGSDSEPELAVALEAENADESDAARTKVSASAEAEARRVARLFDREARAVIRTLLDELIAEYNSDAHGVEIREIAGGFRMATKPECHDAVRSFVKSLKPPLRLSLPALETLAVIAYKQPVTAPEVNEIRGVDSSGVFGSLLARKLISTAGRKPVIGRPILYKTTREFLLRFGLKDVSELPSMEEFEKLASIEFEEPEPGSDSASATTLDLDLEIDEEGEKEISLDATPATTPTAETAASTELPPSEEAAPAAPPATEQAETEHFPDGEEVKEER